MPIKLQGDEGYFSRAVEIEGTEFNIRELPDEAAKGLIKGLHDISVKVAQDSTRGAAALSDLNPEDLLKPEVLEELTAGLDPETQWTSIDAQRQLVDDVIVAGVVAWNIPGHDCTPETRLLLPNWVKMALAKAILDDTFLRDDEALFSGRSRGR